MGTTYQGKFDTMCRTCGGLVADPQKAYGYAGRFCHCPEPARYQLQPEPAPCYCRGPQNGEPVCPCQMRDVKIVDGRYVRITDLGPAPAKPPPGETRFFGTD